MTGEYIILRLPKDSLCKSSRLSRSGKNIVQFYIKGNTFSNVPNDMLIRLRAFRFAMLKNDSVYVVLHRSKKGTECLFFFTLTAIPSNRLEKRFIIEICRCAGKKAVKRSWSKVYDLISKLAYIILDLSYKQSISFSEENHC